MNDPINTPESSGPLPPWMYSLMLGEVVAARGFTPFFVENVVTALQPETDARIAAGLDKFTEMVTGAGPAEENAATGSDDLTDEQFALADRVEAFLDTHPNETWAPSQIARGTGRTTTEVRAVLAFLVKHRYIVASGNGAWTRYTSR